MAAGWAASSQAASASRAFSTLSDGKECVCGANRRGCTALQLTRCGCCAQVARPSAAQARGNPLLKVEARAAKGSGKQIQVRYKG